MSYLELKNIHKSYYLNKEEFKVLKGISLNFDKGEFVSILGESGGGKSTLLNIIGGLDHKYEGDVLLQGQSLKDISEKQLDHYRAQTVGFIFQSFNLISHLTNLENVMVPLEMTYLSRKEREARATELLKRVGLAEHMHKHPNQLSGGQKQLDSQNTEEVLKILEGIAQEGKLVICVTHSEEVAEHGTRIVHIVDGKIAEEKNLRDAYPVQKDEQHYKTGHLSFWSAVMMALQHMRYNLKRNILIIFGVAIGIFSVVLMLGLGKGVQGYINNQISSQINPNTVQVAKNVPRGNGTPNPKAVSFSDANVKQLAKIKNVKATERGYFTSNVQFVYGKKNAVTQLFQTQNKTQKASDIKTGHAPKANELLLTKQTAKNLDSNYKKLVGQKVTLYVTALDSQNRPIRVTKKLTVSGIIDSGTDAVPFNTLKQAYQAQGLTLNPNFVAVTVNNTANVKPVQAKIKTFKQTVNGKQKNLYTITGVGAVLDTLNTYIMLAFYVLAAIAGISLLVSAIMIIVVLYISVSERTKEIGILRAIGSRKRDIRNLFTSEAFFLGLFGSVVGSLLAVIVEQIFKPITLKSVNDVLIQITPGYIIFAIVISIVIALLAALAPSRKAAKIDPIESLSAD